MHRQVVHYLTERERERERDDRVRSFTLIELLIVVAIIGILAALIIVSLVNANNQAKYQTMRAQMKEISDAANMYFLNEGGGQNFPPLIGIGSNSYLTPEYLSAWPSPPYSSCFYAYQNCDPQRGGSSSPSCSSGNPLVYIRTVASNWAPCPNQYYMWCVYDEVNSNCAALSSMTRVN